MNFLIIRTNDKKVHSITATIRIEHNVWKIYYLRGNMVYVPLELIIVGLCLHEVDVEFYSPTTIIEDVVVRYTLLDCKLRNFISQCSTFRYQNMRNSFRVTLKV